MERRRTFRAVISPPNHMVPPLRHGGAGTGRGGPEEKEKLLLHRCRCPVQVFQELCFVLLYELLDILLPGRTAFHKRLSTVCTIVSDWWHE